MKRRKARYAPTTTIRLLPSEKQLIRVAAGLLNKSYQTYMRETVLEHAWGIIDSHGNGAIQIRLANERKITFLDD